MPVRDCEADIYKQTIGHCFQKMDDKSGKFQEKLFICNHCRLSLQFTVYCAPENFGPGFEHALWDCIPQSGENIWEENIANLEQKKYKQTKTDDEIETKNIYTDAGLHNARLLVSPDEACVTQQKAL
ncbi:hypothetical protein JTB14_022546 [Gonioctena quinquepunctata]|nr:hypothetical protein JTB14_022546 [Gonioctena quinquepunctata]